MPMRSQYDGGHSAGMPSARLVNGHDRVEHEQEVAAANVVLVASELWSCSCSKISHLDLLHIHFLHVSAAWPQLHFHFHLPFIDTFCLTVLAWLCNCSLVINIAYTTYDASTPSLTRYSELTSTATRHRLLLPAQIWLVAPASQPNGETPARHSLRSESSLHQLWSDQALQGFQGML